MDARLQPELPFHIFWAQCPPQRLAAAVREDSELQYANWSKIKWKKKGKDYIWSGIPKPDHIVCTIQWHILLINWRSHLGVHYFSMSCSFQYRSIRDNCFLFDRSDTAILYNDRSVLESHHVSAAYRLLQDDDEMNILYNLSKDDWRSARPILRPTIWERVTERWKRRVTAKGNKNSDVL